MPSVSKKQQRFFGMIYGADKVGKKLKGKAGKAQKSMTKKQVKDFVKLKEDIDIDFEKLFYLIERRELIKSLPINNKIYSILWGILLNPKNYGVNECLIQNNNGIINLNVNGENLELNNEDRKFLNKNKNDIDKALSHIENMNYSIGETGYNNYIKDINLLYKLYHIITSKEPMYQNTIYDSIDNVYNYFDIPFVNNYCQIAYDFKNTNSPKLYKNDKCLPQTAEDFKNVNIRDFIDLANKYDEIVRQYNK